MESQHFQCTRILPKQETVIIAPANLLFPHWQHNRNSLTCKTGRKSAFKSYAAKHFGRKKKVIEERVFWFFLRCRQFWRSKTFNWFPLPVKGTLSLLLKFLTPASPPYLTLFWVRLTHSSCIWESPTGMSSNSKSFSKDPWTPKGETYVMLRRQKENKTIKKSNFWSILFFLKPPLASACPHHDALF